MWRIFTGIPRAIRQQFHGPRAAAGICKEEEQVGEHTTETGNAGYCTSWFERSRRCASSPPENQGERDGAGRGDDWWNVNRNWFYLCGRHSALEAVTWGAAVILGIHLSRPRWSEGCIRHRSTSNTSFPVPRRCPSLLYQVAFALPGRPSTRQSVLDTQPKRITDGTSEKKEDNGVNGLLKEFENICKKYTALGKSVLGLSLAQEGNMSEAVKHLEESSELGHASAHFNLGLLFETGKGVEVDLKKAAEYYRQAGEEGHAKALYNLALLHLKGEGGVAQDTKLAIHLLEKAAYFGLSEAQTYMGVYYTEEEQQDMEKAFKFFTQASEQHDPEAQYFLAICYEQGWGVEVNECKAAHLYTQSANSGHDGALYNLGVFHEHGLGGIPQDRVSALDLYTKAAAQGNEQAEVKLQEWDAKAALLKWKVEDEQKDSNRLKPKPGINPSQSSPNLTDYVRQNLGQLCLGPTRPASDPVFLPQKIVLTPPEGKSKTEQVLFYLRPEDVEKPDDDVDSGYGSPTTLTPNNSMLGMSRNASTPTSLTPNCSSLGLHRNISMPDFSSITCN